MSEQKKLPKGWLTKEELPPDALIRLEHAGEWVAWDREMTRAVATGVDFDEVCASAKAAGFEHPIFEWVYPLEVRPMDYLE
jgi:hypothetical protein